MTTSTTLRLRGLASPHRPQPPGRRWRRAAALLLRFARVGLMAWIGYLHLHLWLEGYRQIPTDGTLFLLDGVAGLALAALLLVWAAPLAGLAAAGYTASTLGALLISLTVGLFGLPGVDLGVLHHPVAGHRDDYRPRPAQLDRPRDSRPAAANAHAARVIIKIAQDLTGTGAHLPGCTRIICAQAA